MTAPHGLPPAFDADYYLAANSDLAISRDEAAGHYERIGRAEGRVASPLALRENLIKLVNDGRSVLEIGPFCDPLLRGPNVAYLDVLDAEQLRARAREIGKDPALCPAWIDYVGGLEQVSRRFDAVISSHAIEHNPDLIQHLEQVERILEPDGLFCLIIPDKRYCFDHYIAESTVAGVLQAHRERRGTHSLASVIEHVALTTHNDSARHWAGDHGPRVPPDRADRLRNAISAFDTSGGGYIDVHAWYFTPDSFAGIVEALAALNLSGFEVAGVYDPARDRNEFCAVLRLNPAARERAQRRGAGEGVIVLQTADADRYAPMLAVSASNVREYCRRHGLGYESRIGGGRGETGQTGSSRAALLADLAARDFRGWALCLDADAWFEDLDFDMVAYLAEHGGRVAILAASDADAPEGVAFINFGHPLAREWIGQRAAGHAHDAMTSDVVLIERSGLIDGAHARFIRRPSRDISPASDDRLRAVAEAVDMVFRRDGRIAVARPSAEEERWTARLAHPGARSPALVEAPVPTPQAELLPAIIAAWDAMPGPAEADPLWTGFVAALTRRDADALATELAALGRSRIAQGFLGGARQHQRAMDRVFAERLARWTYDKLLSLGEAIGLVRLENPENGPWGGTAQIDPVRLFGDIEAALDADLSPPASIGGYLGIEVGGGRIVHMRMLDAIHAAWRARQIAGCFGPGKDARIAEIGGGPGLIAYYAARLGLGRYHLFDTPAMNVVQAYMLRGAGLDISLPGEEADGLAILDARDLGAAKAGSIDLLLSVDSLSGMARAETIAHLAEARRLGVGHLLSINQEARLADQTPVAELTRLAGGYTLVSRHRHWLRAGHVEELYRTIGPPSPIEESGDGQGR